MLRPMPRRSFDDLYRSLTKGEIQPVYYLHGDEDLLKDDAVRRILALAVEEATRDFNLDRRRAPELAAEEFQTLVETPPMMAARRVVVLAETECLQQRRPRLQALRAAVTAYLGRASDETVLVLVQSAGGKPDAELERGAQSVDCERLPPERVGRWIKHRAAEEGLRIEEDAVRHLQATVGDDLPQLAAELAKLAAASAGRAATAADVTALVGVRRGETAHDFVDAVAGRRAGAAAAMAQGLLDGPGVTGVRLVAALGTTLTGLALARARLDAGDDPARAANRVFDAIRAARPAGLRYWKDEAARWVDDAARWTAPELDAALATLLRADARLKGTRLASEADVVIEAILALGELGQEAA
jgi:DNA polymerase-3 subunit delta